MAGAPCSINSVVLDHHHRIGATRHHAAGGDGGGGAGLNLERRRIAAGNHFGIE